MGADDAIVVDNASVINPSRPHYTVYLVGSWLNRGHSEDRGGNANIRLVNQSEAAGIQGDLFSSRGVPTANRSLVAGYGGNDTITVDNSTVDYSKGTARWGLLYTAIAGDEFHTNRDSTFVSGNDTINDIRLTVIKMLLVYCRQ